MKKSRFGELVDQVEASFGNVLVMNKLVDGKHFKIRFKEKVNEDMVYRLVEKNEGKHYVCESALHPVSPKSTWHTQFIVKDIFIPAFTGKLKGCAFVMHEEIEVTVNLTDIVLVEEEKPLTRNVVKMPLKKSIHQLFKAAGDQNKELGFELYQDFSKNTPSPDAEIVAICHRSKDSECAEQIAGRFGDLFPGEVSRIRIWAHAYGIENAYGTPITKQEKAA